MKNKTIASPRLQDLTIYDPDEESVRKPRAKLDKNGRLVLNMEAIALLRTDPSNSFLVAAAHIYGHERRFKFYLVDPCVDPHKTTVFVGMQKDEGYYGTRNFSNIRAQFGITTKGILEFHVEQAVIRSTTPRRLYAGFAFTQIT